MKRIRNVLAIMSVVVFGALVIGGTPALAATGPYSGINCSGKAKNSPVCSASKSDPVTGSNGVIVKVTRLLAIATGFAAVIIMIIAGIKYITSNGDASNVASAKSTIIYAAVGLMVVVLAQAIITFVVSRI